MSLGSLQNPRNTPNSTFQAVLEAFPFVFQRDNVFLGIVDLEDKRKLDPLEIHKLFTPSTDSTLYLRSERDVHSATPCGVRFVKVI